MSVRKCQICGKCYLGIECYACKGKMHSDEVKVKDSSDVADLPEEFKELFGFNK